MYVEDIRHILNYKLSDEEKLKILSEEFVSIFWSILLKEMRESVQMMSPEETSFALSTYYGWYDDEMSKILAKSNDSLANILYKELVKGLDR
ncbi:MAG: hypothetical protein N2380_02175 [bacterium]|nr:hypothetical protein [bacterium]